jgi:hypothetical protein
VPRLATRCFEVALNGRANQRRTSVHQVWPRGSRGGIDRAPGARPRPCSSLQQHVLAPRPDDRVFAALPQHNLERHQAPGLTADDCVRKVRPRAPALPAAARPATAPGSAAPGSAWPRTAVPSASCRHNDARQRRDFAMRRYCGGGSRACSKLASWKTRGVHELVIFGG